MNFEDLSSKIGKIIFTIIILSTIVLFILLSNINTFILIILAISLYPTFILINKHIYDYYFEKLIIYSLILALEVYSILIILNIILNDYIIKIMEAKIYRGN